MSPLRVPAKARSRARPPRAPARLGDVARHARVSTATVSRAINQTGAVSDATRQRVLRAVQKLHYYPNAHARTLALISIGMTMIALAALLLHLLR